MRGFLLSKPFIQRLGVGVLWMFACGLMSTSHAGLRGPGKYSGVVIFDRWDTCFLLSGPFITYISERVKNDLRPYKGHAVEIYASEVSQPENPGDALVREYKVIGPAPDNRLWPVIAGIEIETESEFRLREAPSFAIKVRNVGSTVVQIDSSEIGPTLLGPKKKFPFCPSDGQSVAWITRGNLVRPLSWSLVTEEGTISASYTIDPANRLPERFNLSPGQSMEPRITLRVPAGQYQFMVGYGGGVHEEKSLASDAISFDLSDDGLATLAK